MKNPIDRLAAWYSAQCNGEWEHQQGVEITTLDNPGWRLRIDLAETELESARFDVIEDGIADDRPSWKRCWREGTRFHATCSQDNLTSVIESFLDWAEKRSGLGR